MSKKRIKKNSWLNSQPWLKISHWFIIWLVVVCLWNSEICLKGSFPHSSAILLNPVIYKINLLFGNNKYRNFIVAPMWFISNGGFVESKLVSLTVRSCIPGFSLTSLYRKKKAVSCWSNRESIWLLSGEKCLCWGHWEPVQKLSRGPGAAGASSCPRRTPWASSR